jgi:hypothetical protein
MASKRGPETEAGLEMAEQPQGVDAEYAQQLVGDE